MVVETCGNCPLVRLQPDEFGTEFCKAALKTVSSSERACVIPALKGLHVHSVIRARDRVPVCMFSDELNAIVYAEYKTQKTRLHHCVQTWVMDGVMDRPDWQEAKEAYAKR